MLFIVTLMSKAESLKPIIRLNKYQGSSTYGSAALSWAIELTLLTPASGLLRVLILCFSEFSMYTSNKQEKKS